MSPHPDHYPLWWKNRECDGRHSYVMASSTGHSYVKPSSSTAEPPSDGGDADESRSWKDQKIADLVQEWKKTKLPALGAALTWVTMSTKSIAGSDGARGARRGYGEVTASASKVTAADFGFSGWATASSEPEEGTEQQTRAAVHAHVLCNVSAEPDLEVGVAFSNSAAKKLGAATTLHDHFSWEEFEEVD